MQLEHSFSVPVGIDEAWRILIDVERIGPCMPGAAIDSVDGDEFTGTVKVKLGPINLTYKGKAAFVEKDAETHRAVIDARGRDARGNGTASAKITATLHENGPSTLVKVNTDLDITGKPAQFGRGVMVDVGTKLLGQFATSLASTLSGTDDDRSSGAAAGAAPAAATAAPDPADAPAGDSGDAAAGAAAAASAAGSASTDMTPARRTRPKPPLKATRAGATAPAGAESGDAAAETSASETAEGETSAAETSAADTAGSGTGAAAAGAETATAVGRAAGADPDRAASAEHSPSAASSTLNGHASTPARRSEDDVVPIDLLQQAGPAVAKRLAPVAVALVVVLIAIRRRRKG